MQFTKPLLITGMLLAFAWPVWAAAPSCTVLANAMDTVDGTSYATASITPTANRLILVFTEQRIAAGVAGGPVTPTASGNSLTYTQVATQIGPGASTNRRFTIFRALGAAPSAGVLTISTGAETQTHLSHVVLECSGVPTTGTNGSGAVVQSKTTNDGGGYGTTATITLDAAPSNATNLTIGYGLNTGPATITAGSGYTSLATGSESEYGTYYMAEYKANAQTANMSWTGANSWFIGALELATALPGRLLLGVGQ
jgi:hypothetical protein